MGEKWKIGRWEIDKEDVRSFSRYFLAVALIVWAYNLGVYDAMRIVDYINKACGPGSARVVGTTAEIYITPEGLRADTIGIPQHYPPIDINIPDANNTDGVARGH